MLGAAPVIVTVGESSQSLAGHTKPSTTQPLLISLALFLMTFELPPPVTTQPHQAPRVRSPRQVHPPHLYSHAHSLPVGWKATTHLWNPPSPSMFISHPRLCASTMFYRDALHEHFIILTGLCILLSPLDFKDRGSYEFLSVSPLPGTQLSLNKYLFNKCKRKSDQDTQKAGNTFQRT